MASRPLSPRQVVLLLALLFAGVTALLGWGFHSGALYGLGVALPPDKADYAGEWREANHLLIIAPDGRVRYFSRSGNSNAQITAPLQKFDGDFFTIGVLVWSTTFKVSSPPRLEGDVWRMTSDGIEYVR